jgi:hypothetical protein
MIDGRTVGEVVGDSQAAREISDLWLYIQEKLSRIVRDPKLLPDVKPEHLAIKSLLAAGESEEGLEAELARNIAAALETDLPPIVTPTYAGPERRVGPERRTGQVVHRFGADRRVHAFGRRQSDQPANLNDIDGYK